MAKNFPYFKFISTEWMTGDIVYESLACQGLFINICALYWQRNGELSLEDINKRYKAPEELKELTDRFFSVNNGFISVKFLDEQLEEANHISKTNSDNGKKGGRPKASPPEEKKPTALPTESELKQIRIKEEEELNKRKEEEELKASSTTFFYLNLKLQNKSLSSWLKEKKQIDIESWCMQNNANMIEVFSVIDKDVGKQINDEEHAFNYFKSVAKSIEQYKTIQNKNGKQQPESLTDYTKRMYRETLGYNPGEVQQED